MAALAARRGRRDYPAVLRPMGGCALYRPHHPPLSPGSAERFIYAAREGNASGRELTLVMTPWKGRRDVVGSISLEARGADRLTLGFALAPEAWGRGLATEAAEAIINAGFALTAAIEILASVRVENGASRRVLEKCGFAFAGTGLQGAPARGAMVECHSFRLGRQAWELENARRRAVSARLAHAS